MVNAVLIAARLTLPVACLGLAMSPAFCQDANQQPLVMKPRPFIVGGTTASIADFPWQVALLRGQYPEPTRVQKCGGSVISAYWVLTAAHCVVGNAPSEIAIVAGTDRFASGGQRIAVDRIVVHPQFKLPFRADDIALIRVSSPLQGTNIQTVDLADRTTPISGNLQVTGWGDTYYGSHQGSSTLLKVTVPYVSNATCESGSYNGLITAGMMCAGYPNGGMATCQGDSGGPLVIYGNGAKRAGAVAPFAIEVGVVSWAIGCAAPSLYSVYTRVSEYRDWISDTMAEVVSLVRQDFSDCSNGNVNGSNPALIGGSVTVTRKPDSSINVQISLTHGTENTSYHFFLKCVHILGDIRTNGQGAGSASFNFPRNIVGNQFAFDMYPEGAPSGNKYQSVQVTLH
jgi:secreted trypsin-like serine protease